MATLGNPNAAPNPIGGNATRVDPVVAQAEMLKAEYLDGQVPDPRDFNTWHAFLSNIRTNGRGEFQSPTGSPLAITGEDLTRLERVFTLENYALPTPATAEIQAVVDAPDYDSLPERVRATLAYLGASPTHRYDKQQTLRKLQMSASRVLTLAELAERYRPDINIEKVRADVYNKALAYDQAIWQATPPKQRTQPQLPKEPEADNFAAMLRGIDGGTAEEASAVEEVEGEAAEGATATRFSPSQTRETDEFYEQLNEIRRRLAAYEKLRTDANTTIKAASLANAYLEPRLAARAYSTKPAGLHRLFRPKAQAETLKTNERLQAQAEKARETLARLDSVVVEKEVRALQAELEAMVGLRTTNPRDEQPERIELTLTDQGINFMIGGVVMEKTGAMPPIFNFNRDRRVEFLNTLAQRERERLARIGATATAGSGATI